MKNQSYKILIVEDSETQAALLQLFLEYQGFKVIWTSSAEKALEYLSENIPDLAIVDNNLPGMDGSEFCRQVKMNFNTRSIPTLMLTADDKVENEKHGLDSGADDYVTKHVDENILLLKIKSLLRKSVESKTSFFTNNFLFEHNKILAVDDSPTYLEFLAESFRMDGIILEKATNAKEAIQKLNAEKFDCVLVDLVMPEIDGIQLCQYILNKRLKDIDPIVVMMLTARDNKEEMKKALDAGADDFVGKSNDISIIKTRMAALLRRKFIIEENQRIYEELQKKEMEAKQLKIEQEAMTVKAAFSDKLAQTVLELEKEIVERKNLEIQLKKTLDELQCSNQKIIEHQKDMVKKEQIKVMLEMAGAVCHELNQPLQVITGYSELLISQLPLDTKLQSRLNIIKEQIDHMGRITRKLMNITSYQTKEYAHGSLIVDIDESSS